MGWLKGVSASLRNRQRSLPADTMEVVLGGIDRGSILEAAASVMAATRQS